MLGAGPRRAICPPCRGSPFGSGGGRGHSRSCAQTCAQTSGGEPLAPGRDDRSGEARLDILTRVNRAGARGVAAPQRSPALPSPLPRAEVIDQFAEFAAEYRANVVRIGEGGLPEAVARLLAGRGGRVVVPSDLPAPWLPAGLDLVRDGTPPAGALSTRALDGVQAVVTGCAVAIAETGTVVLDHGAAQGRRALSLIPDHHVCVVFARQIVGSLSEAVAGLEAGVLAGRPLTWISGPSATSDIELSRVEGVHGPRVLDILAGR